MRVDEGGHRVTANLLARASVLPTRCGSRASSARACTPRIAHTPSRPVAVGRLAVPASRLGAIRRGRERVVRNLLQEPTQARLDQGLQIVLTVGLRKIARTLQVCDGLGTLLGRPIGPGADLVGLGRFGSKAIAIRTLVAGSRTGTPLAWSR